MSALWSKVRDPLIRAVRTFAQTALGVWLAGLAVSPTLGDLSSTALLTAAAAAGIVAAAHNVLEELSRPLPVK